jgi:hypothetical protein
MHACDVDRRAEGDPKAKAGRIASAPIDLFHVVDGPPRQSAKLIVDRQEFLDPRMSQL